MRNLLYSYKIKMLVSVSMLLMILSPITFAQDANAPVSQDVNTSQDVNVTTNDINESGSQDANVPFVQEISKPKGEDQNAEVLSAVQIKMKQKVTVDFRETPIEDVLRMLAKQARIDIVKSPAVTGNVTATLTDIPLGEALDNILATNGYGYITSQNMIRIVPRAEIYDIPEKIVDRVYRVTYADVREVEKALQKFLSKQGSISSNPGTSNIIRTDIESKMKAIDSFMKEVDRITPQILVEVRIYDITGTDKLDLGVKWFAGTNTIFNKETGRAVAGEKSPFIGGMQDSAINNTTNTGSLRFGWINDDIDIDVILKAQQQALCTTLLANPKIMVLDNQTAHFESITEIPYQELTQTSAGGNIGTTSFREVGVKLDVVPHLTREQMVRLRVMPEFSVDTGRIQIVNSGIDIRNAQPIIDRRRADTTLLVKDNQTIVLGGLKRKTVNTQQDKIPVLGDIPIIGWIFKFHGESDATSELVVFLTPRIIVKPAMSPDEIQQLDVSEFAGPKPCETLLKKDKNGNAKLIR